MKRLALALTFALVAVLSAPEARPLTRPLDRVVAAIVLARPSISRGTAQAYARIIRTEATRRHFDPFTVVAIVRHESRFNAATVGGMDRQCIGLGQICLHNWRTCRASNFTSPDCLAKKSQLMDGAYNLHAIASLITRHREFCRQKTGKPALFARWLSSYQGFNDHARSGRRGVWCNMRRDARGRWRNVSTPKLTRAVIAYRARLVSALR